METDLREDVSGVHRLLTSVVTPRPIAWTSTVDEAGVPNLAPYSYFNLVHTDPPVVMFAAEDDGGRRKDTPSNAVDTGAFVVNLVTEPLADRMDRTSRAAPPAVNEFEEVGLEAVPATTVDVPRVAEAAAHLECVVRDTKRIYGSTLVFGDVQYARVDDDLLTDGRVDAAKVDAVGRLGGPYFTRVDRLSLTRRTDY